MVTDAVGTILSVNPAFTEITGYTADEAIGQNPRMLKSDRQDPKFYRAMWEELASETCWQGEIWNRRKNGDPFIERITIRKIRNAVDGSDRYVSVFSDIIEVWRKSERVRHLAYHDVLTDLPNRSVFIECLNTEILAAAADSRSAAVMFIGLDGFKAVNDRLGHDVGDALLKVVAKKIAALMRPTDMVARIGGDEFVALLFNVKSTEPPERIARNMIEAVNEPIFFTGARVQVGVSIGIAMYPTHGRSAEDLLREADAAMYAVKSSGKNSYRFAQSASETVTASSSA